MLEPVFRSMVAALAVAVPSVRFTRDRQPVLAAALRETADRANAELAAVR